jgi:hypothetical protein
VDAACRREPPADGEHTRPASKGAAAPSVTPGELPVSTPLSDHHGCQARPCSRLPPISQMLVRPLWMIARQSCGRLSFHVELYRLPRRLFGAEVLRKRVRTTGAAQLCCDAAKVSAVEGSRGVPRSGLTLPLLTQCARRPWGSMPLPDQSGYVESDRARRRTWCAKSRKSAVGQAHDQGLLAVTPSPAPPSRCRLPHGTAWRRRRPMHLA